MTFWNGMLWLCLLAMAFFVGGQPMLAAVVAPVLKPRLEHLSIFLLITQETGTMRSGTVGAVVGQDV
jgi:hypothetical protein